MFVKLAAKLCGLKVRVKVDKTDYTSFDFNENQVIIGGDIGEDLFGFYEHLVNRHNCGWAHRYDYKTWSFLHEVGHFYTQDEEFEQKKVGYFDQPEEWAATEWATNFTMVHPNRARIINWLITHSEIKEW